MLRKLILKITFTLLLSLLALGCFWQELYLLSFIFLFLIGILCAKVEQDIIDRNEKV